MTASALQWDDLRIVLAIAEQGTLSAAAVQLNVSHPTLSRRLQRIERRLGTRLFDRLPTALRPTEAGEEARRLALRLRGEINALEQRIGGRDAMADGTVRLTAPDAVAEYLLPDMLAAICRHHPSLQLDLMVSNQVVPLAQRQADIALRVTAHPDDTLSGRQVGQVAMAVYAAADLAGAASDVASLPWVGFDATLACSGPGNWIARNVSEGDIRLRANTLLGAAQAVRAGIGCGVLPCFVGGALPDLVRLGEPLPSLAQPLWLLMHPDTARLARVRRASEALAEQLRAASARLAGQG
ncbi:LysR family transcriptional regulator [Roseateles sp.]|uniref:LysR family transcriptional regulator n=1 Tax=Roseateles sp. TaxID=1971397 RepID=UPI0039ECB639